MRKPSAFTLIELLISISIFMIFLAIVSGSYTTLVKANTTANEEQKIYQDVRNVLDTVSDEMRSGELDFSYSASNQVCSQGIPILHAESNTRTIIRYDATKKRVLVMHQAKAGNGLVTSWINTDRDWQSLTSEAHPVDAFQVTCFPNQNPYERANAANDDVQWQPSVTVSVTVNGYAFRSSYSSRTYGQKTLYQ